MNTRSLLVLLPLLAIVSITTGSSVAYAEVYSYNGNNYSIPAGYQSYNAGIYFNPSTGTYLNPVTGQTSSAPLPSVATGMFVVPQGYTPYNYDTYYNTATGMYFNRLTGQTSMYSPTNPATYNPDGTVKVTPGYTYYSNGVYYNPTTNSYWSTTNGTYSPTLPNPPSYVFPAIGYAQPAQVYTQPVPTYQIVPSYTVAQAIPTLPNTGAGGDAAVTIVILLASATLVVGGIRLVTKRA